MQKSTIPDETIDTLFNTTRSARRRTPTPAPAARLVGRVACAVCGLRADVLICKECSELPDARGMVQGWLDANTDQQDVIASAWLSFAAEHADAWDTLRRAENDPDYPERCDRARKAGNTYGQLLDRHAAYEAAMQPLRMERERLERALSILNEL